MDATLRAPATVLLAAGLYTNFFACVVVYTRRDATVIRLCAAITLAILTEFLHDSGNHMLSPLQQRVFGPMLWHNYLSLVELILFSRADRSELGDPSNSPPGPVPGAWLQALALIFNPRRVGTKWEVKGIPKRSKPQGRFSFAFRSVLKALLASTIIDAILRLPPKPEPHLLEPGKETLYAFWTLSSEDIIFRFMVTLMFTIITCLTVICMYYFAAALTVAIGLNKPESWPPIFGSLRNAYTIRGLWNRTWHQVLRRVVVAFGDFTSDNILCIPRGSILSRLSRLFFPFFMSGTLHYIMELKDDGLAQGRFGVLVFFLLQPLGILLEEVVHYTCSGLFPRTIQRTIGYIWVGTWFWWSMAGFCFEQSRTDPPPDLAPIPFVLMAKRSLLFLNRSP
ncbi:unnamed protein product [Clonostachys rosea f. rosea IK726]|uniref:Wax synthase domain-containing protein n=2 Tax=Bionectria ochroleuca TaxID=29856 RepID=A0A0B7KCX9_BIOOC|nr:unnamed protein product [Clonostachys rosea f. rosea IK726]